ncbi:MAG: FAD-binding oxidoreductase [Kiritimatiellae bacterium]|nr:FAD-binding oxidoreductase [Kiritimatiellia bacterium]
MNDLKKHKIQFTPSVPVDYLHDESRKTGTADAIAFPQTYEESSTLVRAAAASGAKDITVQGSRTGIAAGAVPDGGVIINLSKMDRIDSGRADAEGNAYLRVQPGLTLADLRRHLNTFSVPGIAQPAKWIFTPDPTETSASIGGMAACNASGACSFAYGPTRDHVEALTVVLSDGDTLRLTRGQQKASGLSFSVETDSGLQIKGELPRFKMPDVKNASGYWIRPDMDLLDLFIGSEGTLGIIADVELRLRTKPPGTLGVLCYFSDESDALRFITRLRKAAPSAAPDLLTAIEYFDDGALALIRANAHGMGLLLPPPKLHWSFALYIEWALESGGEVPADLTGSLLNECGGHGSDTWVAADAPSMDKLRTFRHAVPEQVNAIIAERKRGCPDLTKLGTDLSVPDNHLLDVMRLYRRDLHKANLEHVIFGHIGNNHVHVNILPRDMDEYLCGKELYRAWAQQVVEWGGSVSAEHGIGRMKKDLLALMYGAETMAGMRRLKNLFDPARRLNSGRLFD